MHSNCQSYHHHVSFVSFQIFYDPIRRTFLALGGGGGCVRTPRTPPTYGPASWYLSSLLRKGSLGFFKGEWRASESDEYNGGLGKRKMSARGFLGRCTITLLPVFVHLKATAEKRGFNLFLYRGKCWHSTILRPF